LIIYYVSRSKANKRVGPGQPQQPSYYAPQPAYQQQGAAYRQPRAPQAAPGEVPWNARRY